VSFCSHPLGYNNQFHEHSLNPKVSGLPWRDQCLVRHGGLVGPSGPGLACSRVGRPPRPLGNLSEGWVFLLSRMPPAVAALAGLRRGPLGVGCVPSAALGA